MAKVERRHRETALASVYGDDWADAPWEDVRELRMAYAETGRDGRGGKRLLISPEPFAQALADFEAAAEARGHEAGRLAEREDAIAHANQTAAKLGQVMLPDHPMRRTLTAFANELQDGEHIGAARKKAGE